MEALVKSLIGDDWYKLIGSEFKKRYMINLSHVISDDRKKYIVYPETSMGIFNIFRELKPQDIKCVILGQDPYHDGSYDGRAFSNSRTHNISPSLANILKEIQQEYGAEKLGDPNLSRLVKQGVFLINTLLTVRKGQPLSHKNIGWETFTKAWINALTTYNDDIVFLMWGNEAQKYISNVSPHSHLILKSNHPSPLSANRGGWFGNNHFRLTNEYLKKHGKEEINWL